MTSNVHASILTPVQPTFILFEYSSKKLETPNIIQKFTKNIGK